MPPWPPAANETVVVITADHGHVAPGGHGGIDPVLVEVPLIFYSPKSNLSTTTAKTAGGAAFAPFPDVLVNSGVFPANPIAVNNPFYPEQTSFVPSTAIAPTVTALLGIPAPRQSLGFIVNEVLPLLNQSEVLLHLRDLRDQKAQLLSRIHI